jgi:hypothetical protein
MILKKILDLIINNYEETENQINNYNYRSINKYLLLLLFIFTFHFIYITYLCGFSILSKAHLIMLLYYTFMLVLKKRTYVFGIHINIYSFVSYFILLAQILFISIHTNNSINVEYYYFSILGSLPFLYNLKEDWIYAIFIFIVSIIFISVPFLFDFNFIPKSDYFSNESHHYEIIKMVNSIMSIVTIFVNIYFVFQKDLQLSSVTKEKETLNLDLNELENKYLNLMKNQFLINNLNSEDIIEIYKLAETNSPFYFEKFCFYFPNFENAVLAINPNLCFNELYFCSLIKLNFDTKKIAQILNFTVRSVESKKYRLKKKLNLNTEANVHEFMIKL